MRGASGKEAVSSSAHLEQAKGPENPGEGVPDWRQLRAFIEKRSSTNRAAPCQARSKSFPSQGVHLAQQGKAHFVDFVSHQHDDGICVGRVPIDFIKP